MGSLKEKCTDRCGLPFWLGMACSLSSILRSRKSFKVPKLRWGTAGDEIRKCNRRTGEPCGVHMCISSLHWSPAVAAAALASSRTRRLRWERTDRLNCTLETGPDVGEGGGVKKVPKGRKCHQNGRDAIREPSFPACEHISLLLVGYRLRRDGRQYRSRESFLFGTGCNRRRSHCPSVFVSCPHPRVSLPPCVSCDLECRRRASSREQIYSWTFRPCDSRASNRFVTAPWTNGGMCTTIPGEWNVRSRSLIVRLSESPKFLSRLVLDILIKYDSIHVHSHGRCNWMSIHVWGKLIIKSTKKLIEWVDVIVCTN